MKIFCLLNFKLSFMLMNGKNVNVKEFEVPVREFGKVVESGVKYKKG